MSIKLKLPRIITAKHEPLTFDQLDNVVPAMFNRQPGSTTLSRYATIPTVEAVQALQEFGYGISQAAQARSPNKHFDREAKHVIRMRHTKYFDVPAKVGAEVPELILVNAHDASSKFFIYIGVYRFICTNGLMAGETMDTYQIKHTGTDILVQMQQLLDKVTNDAIPMLENTMSILKQRQMTPQEQQMFAARAINLRWPEGTDAVTTQALLHTRRPEDAANDAWHVLNRVQENILQGGFYANNSMRRIRPLEQVGSVVNVNRGLWDLAMRMAA